METQEIQIQNLEVRLRRLEQLHIWASVAIFVGVAYYVINKK